MKKYRIIYDKSVIKFFHNLSKTDSKLVTKLLKSIQDLETSPYKLKKLKGKYKEFSRIKKGKYRTIFKIDKENNVVRVLEVGKRSNIYK